MESAAEWIILVCSIVLLGLYIAVEASRSACTGAHGFLKSVFAWPRWRGARDTHQSPMDAFVEQLMGEKREDMVTIVSSVSQVLLSFAILLGGVNMVRGYSRIRNTYQDGIMLACFGLQVLATWKRKFGSGRVTILFVYAVGMLSCTAFVIATTSSRFAMMMVNTFMVVPRVIFSLAYVKSGTVCLLCLLHTVASSLSYAYLLADDQCEASVISVSPLVHSFNDSLCSGVVVLLTLGWERTMTKHARQELEVTATRGETTATRRLLNTICDATFELDANLRIVDDALQLASALQHGCDRSLRGAQAEQLLVAEDRDPFRERITAPVLASQSMANVLHVRMRDSLNNILKLELFHVTVVGSLTGASHLIGVREYADYGEYPFQQIGSGLVDRLPGRCEAPLPCHRPEPPATRFGTPAVAVPESTCSSSEALATTAACRAPGAPARGTASTNGGAAAAVATRHTRTLCNSSEIHRSTLDGSPQQPLSVKFDAISFVVLESSGTHSDLFCPNTSFLRFVPAQQELFTDLSAGVLSLNRTLPCVPNATFSLQSTIAIDRDGTVLEGACTIVLARGTASEACTSSQHPIEACLQVAQPMRKFFPTRAKKPSSGSPSSGSNSVGSVGNRRDLNSSYLMLMMQGLQDENAQGQPQADGNSMVGL